MPCDQINCHCICIVFLLWLQFLLDSESEVENSISGVGGSSSSQSTAWKGVLKKCARLWPFIWPHGSTLLQLCVLVCVGLLVAGRVVNLFMPIYYKKIGISYINSCLLSPRM